MPAKVQPSPTDTATQSGTLVAALLRDLQAAGLLPLDERRVDGGVAVVPAVPVAGPLAQLPGLVVAAPCTRRTRAPKTRSWATFGSGANSGTKMTQGRPTLAAAPASDVAALPVEAQATTRARRARARVTPTALARSLKDAVGFRPSSLTSRRRTPAHRASGGDGDERRPARLPGRPARARRAPGEARGSARGCAGARPAPVGVSDRRTRARSNSIVQHALRPAARTGPVESARVAASRSARRRGRSRRGRRSLSASRATPSLPDPAIRLLDPLLLRDPVRRVLLRPQLLHVLALLLDPGEVLLVVPALPGLVGALEEPGSGLLEDATGDAGRRGRPSGPAPRRAGAAPRGSGRSRPSPP